MRFTPNWAALAATIVFGSLSLAGCDTREEGVEELPEVSEVEPAGDTEVQELKPEIVLGPEDEGETILATGWVEGQPLENGFFLRTEYNRVVFVESDQDVESGAAVRVRGRVLRSDATEFNQWEVEALGHDIKPDLDFWRGIYLDGDEVESMGDAISEPRDSARPREREKY